MDLLGRNIGRVRIEAPLGKGGMGAVYQGYDAKLERLVAVKVLRRSRRLRSEAKARFLREARILSKLDHPGICRLFDLVEGEDQDYLILELVAGRTLGALIRDGLVVDAALDIAEQILDALTAAHGAQVVHRDLKPENVMVNDEGQVKVLDFGIARPLAASAATGGDGRASPSAPTGDEDETAPLPAADGGAATEGLTVRGSTPGTLRYMSPEQAQGERVTAASDLFAFGLLLQEMLSGRPAYGRDLPPVDLQRRVCAADVEPFTPADDDLGRLLRDLLAAEPARRPTAAAARRRLRFIRDKPHRRRRSLRRGAVALLVATVGVVLGLVVARRLPDADLCAGGAARMAAVWNGPRRAAIEHRVAGATIAHATDAWHGAARLLDDFAQRWVAAHRQACEATRVHGEQSEALLDQRMACLTRQARKLDALLAALEGGEAADAARSVEAASALPAPESCGDPALLRTPVPGSPPEAVAEAEELLAQAEAANALGRYGDAETLAAQAATQAAALDAAPLQAEILLQRAIAEVERSAFDEADQSLNQALTKAIAGEDSETTIRVLNELVWLHGNELGELAAAEHWAGLSRAFLQPLGPQPRLRAELLHRWGAAEQTSGRYDEAERDLRQALALRRAHLGPDHLDTIRSRSNLGNVLLSSGAYEQARDLIAATLASLERAAGPLHPDTIQAIDNLAVAYRQLQERQRARDLHQEAYERWSQAFGATSLQASIPLLNRCLIDLDLEAYPQARAGLEQVEEIWRALLPAGHHFYVFLDYALGRLALGEGRPAQAVSYLRAALPPAAEREEKAAEHAETEFWLARALWRLGPEHRAEALALARKARTTMDHAPFPEAEKAAMDAWIAAPH